MDLARKAIEALYTVLLAGVGSLAGPVGGGFGALAGGLSIAALEHITNGSISDLQDTINALKDAKASGASVWYVSSIWHGQSGRYSDGVGSGNFSVGVGPYDPSIEVLHEVGWMMMSQCADYANGHPARRDGNSPGIPPEQDSSYTPVPVAGC